MPNPPIVTTAYESNFYIPLNIIGFTGQLHNNPTVYFMNDTHIGHITQAHDSDWNVGREPIGDRYPRANWEYLIDNEIKNGVPVAVEKYICHNSATRIHIHTSRTRFFSTQRSGMKTLALLSQAIWRHRNKKAGEPGLFSQRSF